MAYLDSRELAERLDELVTQADEAAEGEAEPLDEEEQEELAELRELESEVSEWQYGATLIPVDEFEQYAQELAKDVGCISDDLAWPLTCIDWEAAADALAEDYSEVTYQGTAYYVRSY